MAVDELKAGTLADELPYGYGWSLILEAEARIEGDTEFNSLAIVYISSACPAAIDHDASGNR